jgi:hypothetical protein
LELPSSVHEKSVRTTDYFFGFDCRRFALGKYTSATTGFEESQLSFVDGIFKFFPKTIEAIFVETASDTGLSP